jgi:hypothetical protein
MASLVLSGDTSGSITVAAPAVAGSNTLTLPAVTGGVAITTADKIGYYTGLGGAVTQATSKSTGVTLDKLCGQITMNSASLSAAVEVTFTVTNSTIGSTDCVIVNHASAGTAGAYAVFANSIANGSFAITVSNLSAGSLSEAIVLNFAVIRGVSS